MTVASTTISKVYDGDGSTVLFTVPFEWWDDAELVVNVRTVATGADVLQVLSTDYTITTGGDGESGSITFQAGSIPTALEEIHIERVSGLTQSVDLTPSTSFPSASVEEAIDRQTLRQQEDRLKLERLVRQPATDEATSGGLPDLELPDKVTRANTFLTFGASGEATVSASAITTLATPTVDGKLLVEAADFAAMRALLDVPFANTPQEIDRIGAGTAAAKPAFATFGTGYYFETDTRTFWYSDGAAAWVQIGIEHFTNATIPAFSADGRVFLDTDNLILKRDTGAAVVDIGAPWCYGAIGGLRVWKSAANIVVEPGSARVQSAANPSIANATLPLQIFKTPTVGGWQAGTGNRGFPTGVTLIANTFYHVFLIAKLDGTTDIGFDVSDTAAALLGTAAGQAGEAGVDFVHYRHLGWVLGDAAGTSYVPFLHIGGDFFRFVSATLAHSSNGNFTGLTNIDVSLGFPKNVMADASFGVFNAAVGTTAVQVTDEGVTPTQASLTVNPGFIGQALAAKPEAGTRIQQYTGPNQLLQVHHSVGGDTATDVFAIAHGWQDFLRSSPT